MKSQDSYFSEGEGDAWYRRNRAALSVERHDWPLDFVSRLAGNGSLGSVLELGCADGWRLSRLRAALPQLRACGSDASAEAIAAGRARDAALDLRQGLLTEAVFEQSFDLVIVNYVLHWLDRRSLLAAVAQIDARVADGGWLIVGDFLPDFPQRRRYHHVSDAALYTWKQDYAALFRASGLYREVMRQTYDHDRHDGACVSDAPSGARGCCTLLRKSLTGGYPEIGT